MRHPNYDLIMKAMQDTSQPIWTWNFGSVQWIPTAFEVLAAHRMNPNEGEGPRTDIVVGDKPAGPPQAPAPALFSPELRERMNVAWFDNEDASGAHGRGWARDVVIHGKQALSEESDEALLERFFTDVDFGLLEDKTGTLLPPFEDEFCRAMADERAVSRARFALSDLNGNACAIEFIQALSDRLHENGMQNPYAELLVQATEAAPTKSREADLRP